MSTYKVYRVSNLGVKRYGGQVGKSVRTFKEWTIEIAGLIYEHSQQEKVLVTTSLCQNLELQKNIITARLSQHLAVRGTAH